MRPLPLRLSIVLLLAVALCGIAGGAVSLSPAADAGATEPVAGNATVASSHPPYVAQPPNTTSYLTVPDDRLAGTDYAETGIDIPGATAIDRERLEIEVAMSNFTTRFGNATSASNRTVAVTAATDQLETFVDRARQRQETALQRYNSGTISSQGLVRALAETHATAVAVDRGAEQVRQVGNSPLDYGIGGEAETRLNNMETDRVTISGELRRLLRTTTTGQRRTSAPVYVETSDTDVVLATIVGDNYVRESYIDEAYDRAYAPEGVDVGNRIEELYAGDFADAYISVDRGQIGNTSVLRSRVTHTQGQFEIYYDDNTDGVYKERQTKRLRDAEPLTTQTTVNGSLRLIVNSTHDTGPLQVRLLDDDRQPRNGTVYLDGARVGTTGPDGILWTVDSRGDSRVQVETADGSVSMFVYDN